MEISTIGEKIRAERRRQKLTQADLAKLMGITQSLVGQYERGEINPKRETITRFANALGVNPMQLTPVPDSATKEEKFKAKEDFFKAMWGETAHGDAAIELKKEQGEYSLRIPEYQPLPKVVELFYTVNALPVLKQEIEAFENKN